MKMFLKPGIVLGGYIFSFLGAIATVYLLRLGVPVDQYNASSGMYAFGDSILFLGVFFTLSLIPTSLMFYFLRPYKVFWKVLSSASIVVAVSGPPVALAITLVSFQTLNQVFWIAVWYFGSLRLAVSPLLLALFLFSSFFSPERLSRMALAGSALLESAVCAYLLLFFMGFAHF